MNYKRTSFCGPAGNGKLSQALSYCIATTLKFFNIKIEKSCQRHDVNWEDGPDTVDDMQFALDVYKELTGAGRHGALAGFFSITGFLCVRLTAIAYKHL